MLFFLSVKRKKLLAFLVYENTVDYIQVNGMTLTTISGLEFLWQWKIQPSFENLRDGKIRNP